MNFMMHLWIELIIIEFRMQADDFFITKILLYVIEIISIESRNNLFVLILLQHISLNSSSTFPEILLTRNCSDVVKASPPAT